MGRPRLLDNSAVRGVALLATALALPAVLACPPITPEGTIPGTCDVGSPGCKQGPQCQSREDNAFMPLYHIMGNFTCVGLARVVCWLGARHVPADAAIVARRHGVGTQPIAVNDVSSVILYKGVWHIFHQFGQCGWAHAVSHDGAHWRNLRYPLTPDDDPAHFFDAKGSFDGSLTVAEGVNGGTPVILYDTINATRTPYSTPRRACGAGGWGPPLPAGSVGLGDAQTMAVARPAEVGDAELQYWRKDGPITFDGKGTCFPSQVWRNGEHFNFVADGERWTTTDPTLRSWTAVDRGNALNGSEGFPTGGNGGEWFVPLPQTTDGRPPPPGSPTHVISVRSGNQYLLGEYFPKNERFVAEGENCQCCPIPPTCVVDEQHELDHGYSFSWAALQRTANRTMNSGWIVGIAARGSHDAGLSGRDGANRNPPGSALSLTREIKYDACTRKLVANPMPELNVLRNGSLFNAKSMQLHQGGALTTLPLAGAAGDAIDFSASFVLQPERTSVGMSVLAHPENISGSTTVRLEVGAPDSKGTYRGNASARIELEEGECPWSNWWECSHPECVKNRSSSGCPSLQRDRMPRPVDMLWTAPFALAKAQVKSCDGAPCVDVRILVDRSIVEIFVAGGRVAALMAYEPADVSMTHVHMWGEGTAAEQAGAAVGVGARDVEVFSMGCGWE